MTQASIVTLATPRILIVDDDPALLEALPEALRLRMRGEPIEIATFDSAFAALDSIRAVDYDAIVSDIKMPEMDGLTLLHKVREARPDTPTLLITGHGEHDLAVQALRGGAYDFIQKPIDRDYFVASLRRAIQTRQLKRQVEEQRNALLQHALLLEETVEERTRELVEANQTKDTFLSVASHELKTPLTTLKTLTQLTRRRLAQRDAPETSHLERMERAVNRMETLINDLVDVSRIESGKLALTLQPENITRLCQHVVEEQRIISEREILLSLPDEPLCGVVDADRINQVLTNLLTNALKFSPAESPVTVTVERRADTVVIAVRDQGSGIPEDEVAHIFERFYQASKTKVQTGSRVGLGLGLYISSEIVLRHGGAIWAESVPDEGSVFYVALPVAEAATVEEPTVAAPLHAQSGAAEG